MPWGRARGRVVKVQHAWLWQPAFLGQIDLGCYGNGTMRYGFLLNHTFFFFFTYRSCLEVDTFQDCIHMQNQMDLLGFFFFKEVNNIKIKTVWI